MLHTKLPDKEMALTAKTYSYLETKIVIDPQKSLNALLPQQSPAIAEMGNYREDQKVHSHDYNSY